MGLMLAVLVLSSGLFLYSCGSENKDEDDQIPDEQISDKGVRPDSVVVMIDKSGSMKGYFVEGSAGEVSGLIECFKNMGNKEGSAEFSDKTPIKNNATELKSAKNFSADTDFSVLLDSMVKNATSNPKVLLTDGIVSTKEGRDDQRQIQSKIKSILERDPSLGFSIVRMQVPYKGDYWIESSRNKKYHSEKLDAPNRPIFAIIVGPKSNVQYISEELSAHKDFAAKPELLTFNIHSDHTTLQFTPSLDEIYNSDEESREKIDGRAITKYVLKEIDSKEGYEYIVTLPSCLSEITKDNIGQAELTINGKKLTQSKKDFDPSIEKNIWGYTLTNNVLTVKLPTSVISYETQPEEDNWIVLSYPIVPENQWNRYYSDDDSQITTDIEEQIKTYGLETIVKAMYDANKNNEVKIKFLYTN